MDTRTQRLMAEVIGSLADRECFLTQLEPCAEALGFDYFSYIVFSCYPASRPKMLIEGNFSANYLEDYRRQRVYLQDPVIERAHHSTLQFQWDESFYHERPTLWRHMAQFGLCAGWSQSVKDCYGRLGILTFAGKALPEQTPQARAVNETFFLWLAQTAHKTLREALISVNDDAIKDVLTLREKDILRWCSEGKTAEEIALLMGLSERTVNFHIGNSIKKLSVANKTAATAKAVYLQLI
ncbi:LuxR family transcriptional regulator [Serratia marcescens]|jgi:DNA-binding CsgD family transcriptional regulator|uniref:LuxR family transcriptional regulator n=1 Tax=Serratia marcescens TaxID=615 RepID=A0AAP8PK87_SERMA|nr:autoinducer binding domain-containing protein [Serratia marcescens]ELQ9311064.1 LuxR family transcriptional regulator [Serratia marcescens]ELQ9440868.1 LuxR family transcriptional regulator [Serratia marcescens]ELT5562217.1 LuxR family transcriptional regulator [Serratia marcescens]MBH1893810.1 LuxR family transcriptional regulator [Serratia marcescens]MBH3257147.1 LuxR family transcriptional regulator [Serratia marcescens]